MFNWCDKRQDINHSLELAPLQYLNTFRSIFSLKGTQSLSCYYLPERKTHQFLSFKYGMGDL